MAIGRVMCLLFGTMAAGLCGCAGGEKNQSDVHATAIQTPPVSKVDSMASSPAADSFKLVWADEFNKNGPLDPKEWRFEQGFVRNEELQWYQPDNAWCEQGFLIIEARREKKPNPRYVAGSQDWRTNREFAQYTSS